MKPAQNLRSALPIVLAIAGGILLFDLIAFAFGQAPASALRMAYEGTWGTPYGIGQVLFKATPLLFTGSTKIALRAGFLRVRRGVHEIITAIMVNRIVDAILPWALATVLGSASLRTADIAPGAALPRLDRVFPSLLGSAASFAFPLAVVSVFVVMELLGARAWGAKFVGWVCVRMRVEPRMVVERRLLLAMLLSGAVAALAVSSTALGYKVLTNWDSGPAQDGAALRLQCSDAARPLASCSRRFFSGTLEQRGLAVNARAEGSHGCA
ncbi:MAG: ABC transporter permease [Polyangiaceae bacterium]|nr:ABC transporter permease [Polyangiaceae bacterium]